MANVVQLRNRNEPLITKIPIRIFNCLSDYTILKDSALYD
jgi:hypothetical protein